MSDPRDRFAGLAEELDSWLVGGSAAAEAHGLAGKLVMNVWVVRGEGTTGGAGVEESCRFDVRLEADSSCFTVEEVAQGQTVSSPYRLSDAQQVRAFLMERAQLVIGGEDGAVRIGGQSRAGRGTGFVPLPAPRHLNHDLWYRHEPFIVRGPFPGGMKLVTRDEDPSLFALAEDSEPWASAGWMSRPDDTWGEVWDLAWRAMARAPLGASGPPYELEDPVMELTIDNVTGLAGEYLEEATFTLGRSVPWKSYQLVAQTYDFHSYRERLPRCHVPEPDLAVAMFVSGARGWLGWRSATLRFHTYLLGDQTDWEWRYRPSGLFVMANEEAVPIRSAEDAEANAASALASMGFTGVKVTPSGADGGIDVEGSGVVAQVKAEVVKTGRPVVQQTYGIAAARDVSCAVFSLAGFTKEALDWADSVGVALFTFDLSGQAQPANRVAETWFIGL